MMAGMALILTATDLQNGSEYEATVTGADPLSSLKAYFAPFTGATTPPSWTLITTRTVDVNGETFLEYSMGSTGFYWLMVVGLVSGSPAATVVYLHITNSAANSVQERIHNAVKQVILLLNLTDIEDVNVVEKWLPQQLTAGANPVPQIQIVPMNGVNFPGIMNNRDDVGYPLVILFIDKQNQDYVANKTRNLLWLETVSKAIRYQRLAGVTECLYAEPEQWVNINEQMFGSQYYVGALGFRFRARETRGMNP
jgi:hypothetical protein